MYFKREKGRGDLLIFFFEDILKSVCIFKVHKNFFKLNM